MTKRRSLEELTLLDRFLFAETMEDPENLRILLEIILGKDLVLKHLPQTEKELRTSPLNRMARVDVWGMDEEGTVYSAESQKRNTGNLPRRSRFYQGMSDSELLEAGEADFNRLSDLYIILIAPFDLFGKGLCRYTFRMRCDESRDLELGDGAVRIFLNTIRHSLGLMQRAGVEADMQREDTDDGILLTIRIPKRAKEAG